MTEDKIEDLDKLLKDYIGDAKKVVDAKITRLTAPGENYGGIMLKADITIQDEDDTKEELHAVAKLIPEEEFFRNLFNIQVSSKVEMAFYGTVVPTLQQFQKDSGVQDVMEFFPRMYAGRINLNGSDTVDKNAVLLLENLKEQGFQNVSRFESFNLPTIKLILKDLAVLHAATIALKLLEPELFQSKVSPYLKEPIRVPSDNHDEPNPLISLLEVLEGVEECLPKLRRNLEKTRSGTRLESKEPFATLVHGDLWVNNIMVKFENGEPVANKFVDFQTPSYQSPAVDLFFLLWTSVKKNILEEHFDHLVGFYHEHFIKTLEELNCDIRPFGLDKFLEELKLVAEFELVHVMFMTAYVVFYNRKSEYSEMPHLRKVEDISKTAKDMIVLMVKTCVDKGWI